MKDDTGTPLSYGVRYAVESLPILNIDESVIGAISECRGQNVFQLADWNTNLRELIVPLHEYSFVRSETDP